MLTFNLMESEYQEFTWDKPLYHGTSLAIARKILKTKQFSLKETTGVNEMGRGVYTHPSMNRTSPWVHLTSKGGAGAFLKLIFNKPLKLAIYTPKVKQRELIDEGFDGAYDKNGYTQVPHQVLLFNYKPLGGADSKLNSELIDWDSSEIIPFDKEAHDYTSGYSDPEQKKYYF